MIYVLAFFFPFIALFVRGMPIQAIFNLILCVIALILDLLGIGLIFGVPLWFICSIWGIISVAQKTSKQRHEQMLEAMRGDKENNM
ncbi:MAG: hypothetical protein J1D99_03875 [Campylobacter sp.]|nr:hypothetical protein [Campylobacter sp.]